MSTKEHSKELTAPARQKRESPSESCDKFIAESRQRQIDFERKTQQRLTPQVDREASSFRMWVSLFLVLLVGALIIAVPRSSAPIKNPEKIAVAEEPRRAKLLSEIAELEKRQTEGESRLAEARYDWQKAKARTDYDGVVRSGAAGASEGLRLTKKQIDNPFYQGESQRLEAGLRGSMERARSSLDSVDQQLKQKRAELLALEAQQHSPHKARDGK
jgi:hypothetical protein